MGVSRTMTVVLTLIVLGVTVAVPMSAASADTLSDRSVLAASYSDPVDLLSAERTSAGGPESAVPVLSQAVLGALATARAYRAVKGLGGVVQATKLLLKAGKKSDFLKMGGNAALEILGVSAIQSNCF
jgi:hypothetical protein